MSRARNAAVGGFTLIELMVVVAIAAILAVIAAPSFTEFLSKRRVDGTMAELVTDVQYARSEAVSRNALVRMSFGTDCYVIHLASATTVACTRTSKTITPAAAEIKTVQFDIGSPLTLEPGALTYFEFDPVRGMAANDLLPAANGFVDVRATSAPFWKLRAVLTLMGRVETCSPSGAGYVAGYSSSCT